MLGNVRIANKDQNADFGGSGANIVVSLRHIAAEGTHARQWFPQGGESTCNHGIVGRIGAQVVDHKTALATWAHQVFPLICAGHLSKLHGVEASFCPFKKGKYFGPRFKCLDRLSSNGIACTLSCSGFTGFTSFVSASTEYPPEHLAWIGKDVLSITLNQNG